MQSLMEHLQRFEGNEVFRLTIFFWLMKFLCNREKLREGLAVANGVIPAKSTKPVLENVCLVATDTGLELLGTDLEVSLRYMIDDVEVSDPGTVVIPARVALDFIRDLSSETVSMELGDDENITIQGGEDSCELVPGEKRANHIYYSSADGSRIRGINHD